MLIAVVTEPTFFIGIRAYLNKYKYGNTQANLLWEEIKKASGQDASH